MGTWGGGLFYQESHSVTRGGRVSQPVSRDGEAYRGKFIPVYNKTNQCFIKLYCYSTNYSENLSGKLFRPRFNKALKQCRFIDNVLNLLLHIKFVFSEFLAQSHIFYRYTIIYSRSF
jgi:hypothetical protein